MEHTYIKPFYVLIKLDKLVLPPFNAVRVPSFFSKKWTLCKLYNEF